MRRYSSWLEKKYSRRRYLKIHFAIDAKTEEIIYMERTSSMVHDSEFAKKMIEESSKSRNVVTVIGDEAYDSRKFIRYLEGNGVTPIIKSRRC